MLLSEVTFGLDWLEVKTGAYVTFVLVNRSFQSKEINYKISQVFTANDNQGNPLEIVVGMGGSQDFFGYETKSQFIARGESIYLSAYGDYQHAPSVFVYADTTNPALNEIIVAASILDITNARWRIKISH